MVQFQLEVGKVTIFSPSPSPSLGHLDTLIPPSAPAAIYDVLFPFPPNNLLHEQDTPSTRFPCQYWYPLSKIALHCIPKSMLSHSPCWYLFFLSIFVLPSLHSSPLPVIIPHPCSYVVLPVPCSWACPRLEEQGMEPWCWAPTVHSPVWLPHAVYCTMSCTFFFFSRLCLLSFFVNVIGIHRRHCPNTLNFVWLDPHRFHAHHQSPLIHNIAERLWRMLHISLQSRCEKSMIHVLNLASVLSAKVWHRNTFGSMVR